MSVLQQSPYLLYSDGKGKIFEDTSLYATGRAGWDAFPVPVEEWIVLPDGGSLYELAGRRGIGIDVQTGHMRLCEKGWAVAAFNANCIGCISFQPAEEEIVSTQDRLSFKPTPEEIVEFTVPHLQTAPFPIVSFGQGCEGEPLLMWETIRESIIEMRRHTQRGSININTNDS